MGTQEHSSDTEDALTAFEGMIKAVLHPLPGFSAEDVVRILEKYNSHEIEVITGHHITARIHKSAYGKISNVAFIQERVIQR